MSTATARELYSYLIEFHVPVEGVRSASVLRSKNLSFCRKVDFDSRLSRKTEVYSVCDAEGSLNKELELPASAELELICSEDQFNQAIGENQWQDEPAVLIWMAQWCRKCVYLKPKMKKLATDYCTRSRFYLIDVNAVPHRLVTRGGVTKMPTIQLWRHGQKKAEVIGGYKPHQVVNDVQEMIDNEDIQNQPQKFH